MNIDQMIVALHNAAVRHPALLQHIPVYEAMRGLDMAEVLRVTRFLEVVGQRRDDILVVRTQLIVGDPLFFRIANVAFAPEIADGSVIIEVTNNILHNEIVVFRRNAPVGNPARALLNDEFDEDRFMHGNDGVDGRAREAPLLDPEPIVAHLAPIYAEVVHQPNIIQNNNNIRNGNNRRERNVRLPRPLYNLLHQNRDADNVPNIHLLQQFFNEVVADDDNLIHRLVALDVPLALRNIVVRLLPGLNRGAAHNDVIPNNIINPDIVHPNLHNNQQEVVEPLVPVMNVLDVQPHVEPPIEPPVLLHPGINQVFSPSKNKVVVYSAFYRHFTQLYQLCFRSGIFLTLYFVICVFIIQLFFTYSKLYYIVLYRFIHRKVLLMFYSLYIKHFYSYVEKSVFKYFMHIVVTYHSYIFYILPYIGCVLYQYFIVFDGVPAPLNDSFLIPHNFAPNKHDNIFDPFSATDLAEFGYKSVAVISIYNEMFVYLRDKNIPCSLTGERARIMMHLANEWYRDNKYILPCDHNIMVNTVKHTCVIVEITQKRLFRELGTGNSGVANITL